MGIINVTPDSFSDGGKYFTKNSAVNHAMSLINDGADILDIGGESSRPPSIYKGVKPISVQDEIDRVVPIIETITSELDVRVSVDTFKSKVALEAIK